MSDQRFASENRKGSVSKSCFSVLDAPTAGWHQPGGGILHGLPAVSWHGTIDGRGQADTGPEAGTNPAARVVRGESNFARFRLEVGECTRRLGVFSTKCRRGLQFPAGLNCGKWWNSAGSFHAKSFDGFTSVIGFLQVMGWCEAGRRYTTVKLRMRRPSYTSYREICQPV